MAWFAAALTWDQMWLLSSHPSSQPLPKLRGAISLLLRNQASRGLEVKAIEEKAYIQQ